MTPPNDWQIRKCLVLSGSLLLAVWGLIGLGALGLEIPVLRQIVAFGFLSFVPGLLLLRILRIHNINIIESLLYSVGLSLAFVMAAGVLANFALPPLGISKPIALLPLLLIITFVLLLLCLFAYIRDKAFHPSSQSDNQTSESTGQSFRANSAPYLLAVLLPLMAILGANLVNAYYNNTLIFALIFVIAIIIGLIAFNKFIHPRVYPFMIFMMALALLYQTTFISDYLVGSDIHLEYYFSKLVLENSYWAIDIYSTINSCLSIVILAPAYSLLLNMDVAWLFKIVYPLLFALMPLALFRALSLQIKSQYAFLAVAFFITMPMFTMDMAQLIRQQVSELFFVLVILLLVDRKLTMLQRVTLIVIFGFGVIVSYYGLGTAYPIGYLACGALVLTFIKSRFGRRVWQWLIGKSNVLPADLASAGVFNKKTLFSIVIVTLAFMFIYYNVVASGAGLSGVYVATGVANSTTEQVTTGTSLSFLNRLPGEPLLQTALGIDFPHVSAAGKIWRILQYIVELCVVIGFFRLIFRPGTFGKLKAEYLALTIVSLIILLSIFVLPTVSYGMGATRIWQITLILMAPLFLFGGELLGSCVMKLAKLLRRSSRASSLAPDTQKPLHFLVIAVLIPYFIFNSGAVFELSRSQTLHVLDIPYSVSLSSHRLDISTVFTGRDISAAKWLSTVVEKDLITYADYHGAKLFMNQIDFPLTVLGMESLATKNGLPDPETVEELFCDARGATCPHYFYLRAWNTESESWTYGCGYATRQKINFSDSSWFVQVLGESDRIYNNGGAQILLHQ